MQMCKIDKTECTDDPCMYACDVATCPNRYTEATESRAPSGQAEFDLLSALNVLVEWWDKKADEHHTLAAKDTQMGRYHSGKGSAYAVCREEIKKIIKSI